MGLIWYGIVVELKPQLIKKDDEFVPYWFSRPFYSFCFLLFLFSGLLGLSLAFL